MKQMRMKIYTMVLLGLLGSMASAQTSGPENGALYIHGGGMLNVKEYLNLIQEVTGKSQPSIVVITTPQGAKREKDFNEGKPFRLISGLEKKYQMQNVHELFILKKEDANQPAAYGLIDSADAVFMTGGNQCYLTDAFLDTEVYAALKRLLERGGVIGGSSAGAQVQSSFMTRGDFTKRLILGDTKHQTGFAFVNNAAFDVHVEERKREQDLFQLLTLKKGELADKQLDPSSLLGIGIDQSTAVIIRKNNMQVRGSGHVYIFNPQLWTNNIEPFFDTLESGASFDLQKRKRL
ncbi:cyanophycinase [Pontiellaceae bacterium B1224]|nr:cyanophycinase [Pontiellaceae bacterium B1224]